MKTILTQLQNLLNLQDCKVNVKLHYQADARPMFVFLSLFSHWLSERSCNGSVVVMEKKTKKM